jgi:hypothetical protein
MIRRLAALAALAAACSPALAPAQETPVGYTGADYTLYVSPAGGGNCTSAAPCTCPQARAAVHNVPLLKDRVRVVASAGTFDAGCALDWYALPTQPASYFSFEGAVVSAALDGGITSGRCNWTTGASPARSTCDTTTADGGVDGGWAPSGLVPFWVRLGAAGAGYPDGTCGTFPVRSNTAGTITLEAASGTGATLPSACAGSLPFAVVDTGTILAGTAAAPGPTYWPPGVAGLPDGGGLNSVVPTLDLRAYGMGVGVAPGGVGAASAIVRWVRFDPGAVEASGVRLAQGADLTLDHVRCDTTDLGVVKGACVAAMGGNRITLQDSQVLRRSDAGTGGVMLASRAGAPTITLKGFGNVARNSGWWDVRGRMGAVTWDLNHLDNPPGAAYCYSGVDRLQSSGDEAINVSDPFMWQWGCDGFTPRMSSSLSGRWTAPQWSGSGSGGSTHYVMGDPHGDYEFDGAGNVNFPGARAIWCVDRYGTAEVVAGFFSAGDAGALVDYGVGCAGGAGIATAAQVDAGTSGRPSGVHMLCGGVDPADGGVYNPRAGCVQLP